MRGWTECSLDLSSGVKNSCSFSTRDGWAVAAMAAMDTPARGFCVGGGFFIARGILLERNSRGVGSRSDPAPRDSSSPVSSLLTVIEWYLELTSKWQGPGNQDATHPTIMQLS
jgi:hypothetical protein